MVLETAASLRAGVDPAPNDLLCFMALIVWMNKAGAPLRDSPMGD